MRPVLVTGATGTVGRGVVDALLVRGVPVRAAARHPLDVEHPLLEQVRFDFTDPATHGPAFRGAERVLLVRPPALGRLSDLAPALRGARDHGVRHAVLLSIQGAERLPFLPHARIERWLRASPVAWTFLRPSFFDQNLVTVHGEQIRRLGEVVVPAGDGRTAFVDALDVAEVAAAVLADPAPHAGRAYTLTGAEALACGEVARTMSAVLGRRVRYRRPGLLRYLRHAHARLGLPPELVLATALVYTTARLGLAAGLTDDLPRLLGRPATTLEQYVARERASFVV